MLTKRTEKKLSHSIDSAHLHHHELRIYPLLQRQHAAYEYDYKRSDVQCSVFSCAAGKPFQCVAEHSSSGYLGGPYQGQTHLKAPSKWTYMCTVGICKAYTESLLLLAELTVCCVSLIMRSQPVGARKRYGMRLKPLRRIFESRIGSTILRSRLRFSIATAIAPWLSASTRANVIRCRFDRY